MKMIKLKQNKTALKDRQTKKNAKKHIDTCVYLINSFHPKYVSLGIPHKILQIWAPSNKHYRPDLRSIQSTVDMISQQNNETNTK